MFNCCTNGVLPDLSDYISLEIYAVYPFVDAYDEQSTDCRSLPGIATGESDLISYLDDSDDNSKLFYTVFALKDDGELEPIHDEFTLEQAKLVANAIVERYRHLEIAIR